MNIHLVSLMLPVNLPEHDIHITDTDIHINPSLHNNMTNTYQHLPAFQSVLLGKRQIMSLIFMSQAFIMNLE